MAETSRFFNGPSYSANDVNNVFYNLVKKNDGITSSSANTQSELVHNSTATYQSIVLAGTAWKTGVFYENSSSKTLVHDVVTTGYKRIDRIVIRLTAGTSMALTIIKGTETTGTPAAPSVTTSTDVMISQLLIDNSTGTPAYTITDEREIICNDQVKRLYVTTSITVLGRHSDLELYVDSPTTPRVILMANGERCDNSGSGNILSLLPKCFIKNIGAATCTARTKSTSGVGSDITLLQNEWVLLHWDSTGWYIMADDFSTEKTFVYTTPGAISHVVPAGRRSCKVFVTGGGAGGGREAANAGDGGGAGGTAIAWLKQLTSGATIAGTVGTGGAARSTDGDGNPGTDSVFNTTIIGNGGLGIVDGGGSASGGMINIRGGGRFGKFYSSDVAIEVAGNGGGSYWGGGGHANNITPPYGAGGCGAIGAGNSGPGADGIIIIQYGDTK